MDGINFNNLLNGNEYVFRIPFDNSMDIFDTIETMLEDLNNNTNILNMENSNNDDFIQLDIQFDFVQPNNEITEQEKNHFKNCNEINTKLCKSEKIKKDDPILSEQCFICMDNYKELELKRTLPNCKHCFHKKCIDKWIKKNASCPVCRNSLI
jgi:hypothetical protein